MRVWLLVMVVLGCSKPAPSTRPAPPADAGVVAVVAPPDAAPPPAPKVDAGPPGDRGDFCNADAECGWDDPCKAARCGKAGEPVACEKSFPPPGSCTCVEHQCTLRPAEPAQYASAPGCTTDSDCAIDVGRATCHLKGNALIGPIYEQGPVCTCDGGSGRCQFTWSGPVACKSWSDCSWVRQPRLRAVPASLVKRPFPKPVRACKDGEVDSVCTPAGVCKIVGWSC